MKKVLILSYHSLPFDTIASYRAMAYLNHLKKMNYNPTLVTHNWLNNRISSDFEIENHSYGRIIKLPLSSSKKVKFINWLPASTFLNKVIVLVKWLLGYLDPDNSQINSYFSFKEFCFKHLKEEKYDVIIGIFSPHHHLRLCHELNKKFGIPYVLDFRDLWDNRIIHKHYQPNFREKIQDFFTEYYWKRWLKKASFFTITSEPWMKRINELTETKGYVINNGYDPELFVEATPDVKNKNFTIIHAGSLYAHQKIEIFLEGCKLFIEKEKPQKFKIQFIGPKGNSLYPDLISGYMYKPREIIRKYLSEQYCEILSRIPKTELLSKMLSVQLLLFPSFPDAQGTFAGKIFDYISSGTNILMVPDDHSVVRQLISETKTGYVANTPDEVCSYLTDTYNVWLKNGKLKYCGDQSIVKQYTRESQVLKMATILDQFLY